MIHINLLPWRDKKRHTAKKDFLRLLVASSIAAVILIVIIHIVLQYKINNQKRRNYFLTEQSRIYNNNIRQIEQLKKLRLKITNRMKVIQQLQASRPYVVHLFEAFVNIIPNGVYFTSITREGNNLVLLGQAEANAQVSQLMRNVKVSPWLKSPSLKIIKVNDNNPFNYTREFELRAKALISSFAEIQRTPSS